MPHASVLIPRLYLLVPIAALIVAIARGWRGREPGALRDWIACCAAGVIAGLILAGIYSYCLRGRVSLTQAAICCYWAVAVIYVLRALNAVLAFAIDRMMGIPHRPISRAAVDAKRESPADAYGAGNMGEIVDPRGSTGIEAGAPNAAGPANVISPAPRACCAAAEVAAMSLRAILLLAIGLPYVLAMALVFRPHITRSGTPASILGAAYEEVSFTASDGVRLSGWWIPAARSPRTDEAHPAVAWGERTVIFCHGFGADKASQLRAVRDLVPNGYNVFAIDLRAHGQSGGQLTTFGDLERRDVLGAVHWVRAHHADACRKIFGLGESLGAAALISAAADPGPDGQAIDALAVFAPYGRLSDLVQGIADDHFAPKAGWFARRMLLPIAGAQLGTRMARYAPSQDVQALWPRPILVIASEQDRGISIYASHDLYDHALQPRYAMWLEKGTRREALLANDTAALAVRVFFEESRSVI